MPRIDTQRLIPWNEICIPGSTRSTNVDTMKWNMHSRVHKIYERWYHEMKYAFPGPQDLWTLLWNEICIPGSTRSMNVAVAVDVPYSACWWMIKSFCHIVCYRTVVLLVLWALAPDRSQVQIRYRHRLRWTDRGWSSSSLCCYCTLTSVNDGSKLSAHLRLLVSCHIARPWRTCSTIFHIAKMESHAVVCETQDGNLHFFLYIH